jgi:hypothetical protein
MSILPLNCGCINGAYDDIILFDTYEFKVVVKEVFDTNVEEISTLL